MTINLEKSLIKNKRKLLTKEEILILDQMEKLEKTESIDMLRSRLGMWDANSEIAEKAKSKLKIHDKYPADRVFSHEDIKSLCLKYGLRFLPSNMFNGELDSELPEKIKQFDTKYGSAYVSKYNSFIAAPVQSFKLQKRPKDPLFFVQISGSEYSRDRGEKHYFLLHKWGKDISVFRWIANLFRRTTLMANLSCLIFFYALGFLYSISRNPLCDCAGKGNIIGGALFTGFLFAAFAFIGCMMYKLIKGMFSDDFMDPPWLVGNEENWDNRYSN